MEKKGNSIFVEYDEFTGKITQRIIKIQEEYEDKQKKIKRRL